MILDSAKRYGLVSRVLHGAMGLLILWQLLKFFDRIAEGEHWVGQTLVPWHLSIGALLLLLAVLRTGWALSQLPNRPRHDPATAWLVKAGHLALYLAMLALPVTGVLYMLGNGYGLEGQWLRSGGIRHAAGGQGRRDRLDGGAWQPAFAAGLAAVAAARRAHRRRALPQAGQA